MTNRVNRVFVGRHFKLQALLFSIVGGCMAVFFYGMFMFRDAPYKLCVEGHYCGKTGIRHSYEEYEKWKQWEGVLIICWPFGIAAAYGLRHLRKQPG
jgi:hypothetical protein